MNIKKLFAVLAGVSMLAQTVVPSAGVFGAEYSEELQGAYNWAYSKGVTTMSSIDNANMYGAITRAEMAKMLSVYAESSLGITADTSKACTFTDIDSVKGDLHDFIIKSCQLGIMGQGITAFRPYDTLSRAEFGTALSRVLWGDKYEGGTPYYANHLNALKAAGIMNQIANAESTKEVRGYVMLMLQRSEGSDAGVDCDDPVVALACSLDTDECPAACKEGSKEDNTDTVVKSGDLDVTVSGDSNGRVFIGRSSDLDTISLKTSEEVTISKITLERIGYSTASNIKNVRLENDKGTVIAEPKTVDSKGQVKLTLKKDYKVVDGTLDATIVVETYDADDEEADATHKALTAGATVWFKVVSIDSTAKNTNNSGKANTYTAVKYDGSTLTFSNFKNTATKEYNWEAGETYEVAKFKVKAPDDSSIILRGFTFKNSANLDLRKYFDKAEVTIAGEKVSGLDASVNKNDELVVTFKDYEVAAKAKSEVVVSLALVDDYDQFGVADRVQLILTDFVAVDGKVESRVSADKAAAVNNVENYGQSGLYTFKGGKIKLANTKLGNVDAALESEDVKVAEGTITVNEAIKGTFSITVSGDGAGAIKWMTVVVNGDETDASKNGNVYTFSNVEIEKSGKVQFLIDTVDATEGNNTDYKWKTINFNTFNQASFGADADHSNVKYDESGKSAWSEVSGSISFSKVTVQSAKASMTNSLTKEVEFNNKETNTKTVFDGTYTAKKGDVKLNEFVISANSTNNKAKITSNTDKITFYVYIDGDEVADAKLSCSDNDCTAGDTFNDVLVKAGESAKIKVEAEVEANDTAEDFNGTDFGTFKLQLKGEDTNGNKAGEWTANTVKIKVVTKWTFNISAGAVKETVLYKTSNTEVAAFTVKPANGASETDLEEISFVLKKDGSAYLADKTQVDGYVTVKLNNVIADDCIFGKDGENVDKNTIVCSFNDKIDSNGAKVSISLDDEATWVITVTGLEINDKPQTREFTKRFESAVVSIESMKDLGGTTQFTLNVEKDSELTVRNLTLTFDTPESKADCSGLSGDDQTACENANASKYLSSLTKVFDDGDTIEAKGIKDEVRLVTGISYWVSKTWDYANCESPENIEGKAYCQVTISKEGDNSYPDFFKVGDQYARTYKSN